MNDVPEPIGVPLPEWSLMRYVKPLPRPLTHEEMARFEAAVDILNSHVGLCMARINDEESSPNPDPSVIAGYERRADGYISLRNSLGAMDFDRIAEVLDSARATTEELSNG